MTNGRFVNIELLNELLPAFVKSHGECEFVTVPPLAVPANTIFSPYQIAEFMQTTFMLMDNCTMFALLDKDYFDTNGDCTSIWTEAEIAIWSYYGRDMIFSKHRKKERRILAISSENGTYAEREMGLPILNRTQMNYLNICSTDFAPHLPGRPDYSKEYRNKWAGYYIIICNRCKKVVRSNRQTKPISQINVEDLSIGQCTCGNKMLFSVAGEKVLRFVCDQQTSSLRPKPLNIFDILALFFSGIESLETMPVFK
jgi:hypothetical protein